MIQAFLRNPWQRVLPDFLIIGAQKSGTTSLYEYLCQHPEIVPAQKKEVHYFDTGFYKGITWYRTHFPRRRSLSNEITGEASPSYLFYPQTARRMYQVVPQARLLVLLRNPVDRAISSYYHQQQKGVEPLSLDEALHAEEQRMKALRKGWPTRSKGKQMRQFSYKARGLYAGQLQDFFTYFSPEQIWVAPAERFFAKPAEVLQEAFAFLRVDASFQPTDLRPRNVHQYQPAEAATRARLANYYKQPNEALYRLLGRRFHW